MLRFYFRRVLAPNSKSFKILSLNLTSKKDDAEKSSSEAQEGPKMKSSDDRGSVSVALIGGGTTPAYTALLLKQEPIIKFIQVVDAGDKAAGLVQDVSDVDTSAKIKYLKRNAMTDESLRDVDIIAFMNEDDFTRGKSNSYAQFLASSRYVKNVAEKMVRSCPTALVAVFAQPVTANLPLVSEIYKCAGYWDPDRIVGSLAIDSMRIEAMAANLLDLNPAFTSIPIVGGADPCTIVPLLSRAKPANQFSTTQQKSLVQSLRASDNELAIVNCGGGANMSTAAAATKLIIALARGYCGFKNPTASAYVRSNVIPICRFFANELRFGPGGVSENLGLPKVSNEELELIEQAIPIINANVDLAMNFLQDRNEKTRSNPNMRE